MTDLNLLWAILAQISSTSLNFIGMTLQKKATSEMPKIREEVGLLKSIKNLFINKKWIFGYVLNFASVILTSVALALAAISIVQPFYGFGLIVLIIFSHFYLKEKITRIDVLGVLIGIAGIVLLGITAKLPEQLDYLELLDSFLNIRGIIFLGVFLGIALIFYLISEKTPKTISVIFLVISSSIWTATSFLFFKAISSAIRDIGIIQAFFGFGWLYTWSFLGLIALVSVIGLILLNISYQNGFCVIVIPIWSSIQVVLPILAGIIIFQEWSQFSSGTIIAQSIGIFLMLVSVVILSISNGKKEDTCKMIDSSISIE